MWSSGKRFSLRRAISLAVAIIIGTELIAAGVRYAFRGETPTAAAALAVLAASGIGSLGYSLVEPVFMVARDSIASRRWRPERLRDVSYGLQTAYAIGLGLASFELAPHISLLAALLLRARTTSGVIGGDARYIIGASIVFLPIVIAARLLAMQSPKPRAAGPVIRPSRRPIPTVDRARIPTGPIPGPMPIQRPARIINVEIGPVEPGDGK